MIKVAIVGAGRMGQEIAKAIEQDKSFALTGIVDAPGAERIGKVINGAVITDDIYIGSKGADIIIDFSGAAGTASHIKDYAILKLPLIVGSTGLSEKDEKALIELSKQTAVLVDANMSIGVNIMLKLAETASRAVGKDFDIEILEAHHRHKKDAPSGTALSLARAASRGEELVINGRSGERTEGVLGIQVLRGGDCAGEHTVFYFGEAERLEITHRAANRAIFAKGGLRAAKWLIGKPAGLYKMRDVLGIS
ncbi:MAG: 4-hydroxy-tetrahydrodipicolinate reductase [Deferribacteraceae bacterium]|jgi:4-hydroxy-tetrahydrodipicolinate reductase|nr:4-hydroxy-tetrahydrodipicolinate reductase [Deferribacteraceae bacterium]